MHSEEGLESEDREVVDIRMDVGGELEAWIPMLTLLFCSASWLVTGCVDECTGDREWEGGVVAAGLVASASASAATVLGVSTGGVAR